MAVSETLRLVVLPASTKTGRAVIEALLSDPRKPKVTGYYRDLARVPANLLASPDFKAVQGDICDGSTLDFEGADAVLAITPPRTDGEDVEEHARVSSQNVKYAVMSTKSVKRLVYLSSMGAQFETGVGEIKSNHIAETILADASFEVVFIRAAYFMENWLQSISLAKSSHAFSSAIPRDWAIPMVSISDIAQACKHVLLARFSGAGRRGAPLVFEMHGPRSYNAADVERAFTEAAGEMVQVNTVPKERLAEYFCKMHLPMNLVPEFVEMTRSFLPGGVMAKELQYVDEQNVRRGDRELVDVVRSMWEVTV